MRWRRLGRFAGRAAAFAGLLAAAFAARATNFQDLWWNPAENGWGVQIVQQDDTLFLTWFIYDAAGRPTWVVSDSVVRSTAPLPQGTTMYTGRVVAATGTFFGAPAWAPITPRLAGNNLSITFTDARTGSLTYTIDGTTVTKPITRQLLANINLTGTYYGGLSRSASGCINPLLNGSSVNTATYSVTHAPATGSLSVTEIGGTACRFTGTTQQYGSLIEASGNYTCAGDGSAGTFTGREGTGGETTFSFKMSMRPSGDSCTVTATLGGFKQ